MADPNVYFAFKRKVREISPDRWATRIRNAVECPELRAWAASTVWYVHPDFRLDDDLYSLVQDYPLKNDMQWQDLQEVLERIGLPSAIPKHFEYTSKIPKSAIRKRKKVETYLNLVKMELARS